VANPLAIELHASAARATSGDGTAVDIGALRSAARLEVSLTAATAGADHVLTLFVETSDSDAGPWRQVAELGTLEPAPPLKLEASVADLDQYVRLRWVVEGSTSPSFTFRVTGEAHVLYAEPKHVSKRALGEVTNNELAEHCITASTEADGYLAAGKKLPLTKWDADLRKHCSKIVIYNFLNEGGRTPTGPEDLIDKEYSDAIKWLKGVGAGSIDPPGLVDSTPEISEESFAVVSGEPRFFP
jgi:phage gp36-like protein